MKEFLKNLQEAEAIIKSADHILYVTYPLVTEKKLLLKIMTELDKAVKLCINTILKYEYVFSRVKIYQDSKLNLREFEIKIASKYNILATHLEPIKKLLAAAEARKNASMEFTRGEKIIILSENNNPLQLDYAEIKKFLNASKHLLNTIKRVILKT